MNTGRGIRDDKRVSVSVCEREGERVGVRRNTSFCEGVYAVQVGFRVGDRDDKAKRQQRKKDVAEDHAAQ